MPTRAYLRLDPHVYERKALGVDTDGVPIEGWKPYPTDALVAFFGTLALADMQPQRGYFRSERILRELLRGVDGKGARYARMVPVLIERGDLIEQPGGRLYVEGWTEWQEGDLTVAERMRRMRARQSHRNGVTPAVTADVTATVTASPSDGPRRSGGGGISNSGGGAPSRAPSRSMTEDDRTSGIRDNVALLHAADPGVRRAALRALHRLDPEGHYQEAPPPTARPRSREAASHAG